jgi:hypothetical protein
VRGGSIDVGDRRGAGSIIIIIKGSDSEVVKLFDPLGRPIHSSSHMNLEQGAHLSIV